MPFTKGDKRAGRPKGTENKVKRLTNDERIALVKHGNLTPLVFLQSVVMDEKESVEMRRRAASDVAPYLHRKKPVAIEGGERPLMILSPEQLANMDDKQISALNAMLIGLGAGLQDDNKSED
jgi:hypothetical protein